MRTQYIEKIFSDYCDWETASKQLYENCAKNLYELGMLADFQKVMELVDDVDCELKILERLYLEIKSVDYNEVYIATMQQELHEKYRKKTKELNIEE